MQVFKLYFKILNKYKGQAIMYMCIFAGLLFGMVLPNTKKNNTTEFTDSTCKYAVFDYDNSVESEGVKEFLNSNHKYVKIADDTRETIQDELYNRNVSAVVVIKNGFGEKMESDSVSDYLEVLTIPGTLTANLFESDLNSFVSLVRTYLVADYSYADAIDAVKEQLKKDVSVSYPNGENISSRKVIDYQFTFFGWVIISMCMSSITPVLSVFNKKNTKDRIECSSYKFGRFYKELLCGVGVTGLGMACIFMLITVPLCKEYLFTYSGGLMVCNALCITVVALAFTFFISNMTSNIQVISMCSNVISLGMSFLCGVFVPMELLGEAVVNIAHFLPMYWYVKLIDETRQAGGISLENAALYMAVQLLFAAVIVMVALIISKNKTRAVAE